MSKLLVGFPLHEEGPSRDINGDRHQVLFFAVFSPDVEMEDYPIAAVWVAIGVLFFPRGTEALCCCLKYRSIKPRIQRVIRSSDVGKAILFAFGLYRARSISSKRASFAFPDAGLNSSTLYRRSVSSGVVA